MKPELSSIIHYFSARTRVTVPIEYPDQYENDQIHNREGKSPHQKINVSELAFNLGKEELDAQYSTLVYSH